MTQKRPWKGVIFSCCGVYGRVYLSVVTRQYVGYCPKCYAKAVVPHTK